ncbi:very-long-chain 3-oxoacyl-CoA synthase [Synchytrium microbalum]|uniref:Elongation of fatty acids protein n=1 Tax=Synchytrium microbalum TaxID=1806994 RepID=A0A507CDR1_9FUNG|nr:very-long-chain 3-oxoacyl-CoA synthase [Synchytrium microbalum]TPX37478.1 very-long-chain 3-oxoacyl-CoA synthase [Synchytrium microbalum]
MRWPSPTNDALDFILAKYFNFSPDDFKWDDGLLFNRHSLPLVAGCSLFYVVVMLGGQEIMKGYEPFHLKKPIFLHNAIMSIASAILFMLILEPLIPMWFEHGLNYAVCDKQAYTPRLELFYYFNFLFKLWEFIDTGFMVLRKRPLEFLHVYHHSAYYAVSSISKRQIWWKKHLTSMQITQFVLDLGLISYLAYNVFTNEAFPWLKTEWGFRTVENCFSADPKMHASVATFVIGSYLLLFIDFYASLRALI